MGAWGAGSFENDGAADWVHEFEQSGAAAVRSALETVSKLGDSEYLEAPEASMAIAAAEIVAAARDGDQSSLSEGARECFSQFQASLTGSDLLELARRAVERTRRQSELKDLWEESAERKRWFGEVDRLSSRLG